VRRRITAPALWAALAVLVLTASPMRPPRDAPDAATATAVQGAE
jgi:hypothetical protein